MIPHLFCCACCDDRAELLDALEALVKAVAEFDAHIIKSHEDCPAANGIAPAFVDAIRLLARLRSEPRDVGGGAPRPKHGARDRVERNEDGSLDDIVLMLEPDLMLHAEEMDDGQWWMALYDFSRGEADAPAITIDLWRGDDGWEAQLGEDDFLAGQLVRTRAPSEPTVEKG